MKLPAQCFEIVLFALNGLKSQPGNVRKMDWVPIVFVVFKLVVFGFCMFFAIKWHHDKDKKKKQEEQELAQAHALELEKSSGT